MNLGKIVLLAVAAMAVAAYGYAASSGPRSSCYTGAFIGDKPGREAIQDFKNDYGKKPYLVMLFLDWGILPDKKILSEISLAGSAPVITWEPWEAESKGSIDYDGLLNGKYDDYIVKFAGSIKEFGKPVYLRFAHEANGDWYPWSAVRLGAGRYVKIYRHVKDLFDKSGANNVKWVFTVNWEDIPKTNSYKEIYPGDGYADIIGIDGYNWGDTQSWSKWMTFAELFDKRYNEISKTMKQPIMIAEFGSTGSGGDKRLWIEAAMKSIRSMKRVMGFVLFNVDKETDWRVRPSSDAGMELKKQLASPHFMEGAI